jgi:hypothetical protein
MSKTTDPKRGTGRTTAIMLRSIAEAIENPGRRIRVYDHCPMKRAQGIALVKSTAKMAATLNLAISSDIDSLEIWSTFMSHSVRQRNQAWSTGKDAEAPF